MEYLFVGKIFLQSFHADFFEGFRLNNKALYILQTYSFFSFIQFLKNEISCFLLKLDITENK